METEAPRYWEPKDDDHDPRSLLIGAIVVIAMLWWALS